MTNRILLGTRSGVSGVFISKPGVDVLTASSENLMLGTDIPLFQIVASGSLTPSAGADYDISVPAMGFTPLVVISGTYTCGYTFPAAGLLRIRAYSKVAGTGGPDVVNWCVTNQRIWH